MQPWQKLHHYLCSIHFHLILLLKIHFFLIKIQFFLIKNSLVSKCPLFHLLGEQLSCEQLSGEQLSVHRMWCAVLHCQCYCVSDTDPVTRVSDSHHFKEQSIIPGPGLLISIYQVSSSHRHHFSNQSNKSSKAKPCIQLLVVLETLTLLNCNITFLEMLEIIAQIIVRLDLPLS